MKFNYIIFMPVSKCSPMLQVEFLTHVRFSYISTFKTTRVTSYAIQITIQCLYYLVFHISHGTDFSFHKFFVYYLVMLSFVETQYVAIELMATQSWLNIPDNKVHGAPHVGPMNIAIWDTMASMR